MFDAYGTVFDVTSAAARCQEVLGERAEALSALWRTKQLQYTWLRSLMGVHADFWQVTGDALDAALEALDIADPALRVRLMECYLTLDAYGDVAPAIERLKRAGLRTVILSNGSPTMLASAVDTAALGRHFDAVLSIEEVGVYKPHRAVYQLASDRVGAAPATIAFVSANGWDAHGAAVFGFRSLWLNRTGQPAERLPGVIAEEITSLSALPRLLGIES